jgi:hypothetical protein
MQKNTPNHRFRGQNILGPDGSVQFYETRFVAPSLDDIYTMKKVLRYSGTERPEGDDIIFAP